MRRNMFRCLSAFLGLVLIGPNPAEAQCALPYQIANGQTADATQIMANFTALVNCLAAGAPAGTTNALQFNAGSGSLGAVGPLTNGQLVVGATGGAPQAATLTAGTGIAITNGPGSITVAATGGGGGGTSTNRTFDASGSALYYASTDGANWRLVYTISLSSRGVGAITRYGFAIWQYGGGGSPFYSDEFPAPSSAPIP